MLSNLELKQGISYLEIERGGGERDTEMKILREIERQSDRYT